jgi:pyrimidine operon attenuation protein/uracil phosphoribosyltransferase
MHTPSLNLFLQQVTDIYLFFRNNIPKLSVLISQMNLLKLFEQRDTSTKLHHISNDELFKIVDSFSSRIENFNFDVLVGLSPNGAIIAHMLQVKKLHNSWNVIACKKLSVGSSTPIDLDQYKSLKLSEVSILLCPLSLFDLPRKTNIVLIDDVHLAGVSGYSLKNALIEAGFASITYISLIDLKSDELMLVPLVVGVKLNHSSVIFPWEELG